jgi:hypothetical protein
MLLLYRDMSRNVPFKCMINTKSRPSLAKDYAVLLISIMMHKRPASAKICVKGPDAGRLFQELLLDLEQVMTRERLKAFLNAQRQRRAVVAAVDQAMAAGGRQQAAGGRQQAAGSRRQAAGGRQQAAGSRRQAAGGRRQASRRHGVTAGADVGMPCGSCPPPCQTTHTSTNGAGTRSRSAATGSTARRTCSSR